MQSHLTARRSVHAWPAFLLPALVLIPTTAWAAPKDRTPPTTPTNLRATSVSSLGVTLAWNASSDNSGSFSYRIVGSMGQTALVPQYYTSYNWSSHISSGNTYSFYVYAFDAAGNRSGNSNTVTVTIPFDVNPPTTPVLSAADVGPTYMSLAWTASTDDGGIVRYWLYMDGTAIVISGQTTSHTVWYQQPGTTHTFQVRARDGKGNWSNYSNAVTVTTPPPNPNDRTPPTVPTNLWAGTYGDGSTEFELSWTASTDDFDRQDIIRYDVYLNGAWLDATVGRTRLTEYGVFGENRIEVTATDNAGNRSAPATFVLNIP